MAARSTVLEAALGDRVTVRLKDGTGYRGILDGDDQHINLVLEGATRVPEAGGPEGSSAERVEDTIVIRGDNVVSINS